MRIGNVEINPPGQPPKPELEDISIIPDEEHDWDMDKDWESGHHMGYYCKKCEEMSECTFCNKDWEDNKDCLRNKAEARNFVKESDFRKAIKVYEAQMEYYKEEVEPKIHAKNT